MELKTNYQYTYFIHPFIVKENRYQKYLLKLLKDKKCNIKIFKKEKDLKLYKYFLPEIRKFLFSSFDFTPNKLKELEKLPIETQSALLSRYPCTMFEYVLEKDIQGKTGEEKGIFFGIRKLEIICFNTGICFLCIKTNIENTNRFDDLLNFNYKFRDINQEFANMNNYDNIRVQSDCFEDVKYFKEFIENLTGPVTESIKLDIDPERFLTFSYACIDQESWNNTNEFEKISNIYIKFLNILPSDNSVDYSKNSMKVISKWQYAKMGVTKQGVTLFASSCDMNNYTVFPHDFEEKYLYSYILAMYTKIYLKKINLEFRQNIKINKTRKEFINFTQSLWINEITADDTGSMFYQYLKDVLEIEQLYDDTKNKYDILYKEMNIEKTAKNNVIITLILVITLIINAINIIFLAR